MEWEKIEHGEAIAEQILSFIKDRIDRGADTWPWAEGEAAPSGVGTYRQVTGVLDRGRGIGF